jgi:hypothetical protein
MRQHLVAKASRKSICALDKYLYTTYSCEYDNHIDEGILPCGELMLIVFLK